LRAKAKVKVKADAKANANAKAKAKAKDVHAAMQIRDATGVCLGWWHMLIPRWGCAAGCSCTSNGGYRKAMILLLMGAGMEGWVIDGAVVECATDGHARRRGLRPRRDLTLDAGCWMLDCGSVCSPEC
jgi:hypothetical protein